MEKGKDYVFRNDLSIDESSSQVPIELLTGQYNGIILYYTDVSLKENEETDGISCSFGFNLMNPGNFTRDILGKDPVFIEYIGLILNDLILTVIESEHKELKDQTKDQEISE